MLYGDEKTRAHHPDGLATEGPQDTVSTLGQGEATSPKIIIPETPEERKRNISGDGFDLREGAPKESAVALVKKPAAP